MPKWTSALLIIVHSELGGTTPADDEGGEGRGAW